MVDILLAILGIWGLVCWGTFFIIIIPYEYRRWRHRRQNPPSNR